MIDYATLKPGQKIIALQSGLWGLTKAKETILEVVEVSAIKQKCTVKNAMGRTMYFEGEHPLSLFDPCESQSEENLGPIAQALQIEILELVGRNAKLGADLAAVTSLLKDHQSAIADMRRLTADLDEALCGEGRGATCPSLCDMLAMVKDWRRRLGLPDGAALITIGEEALSA